MKLPLLVVVTIKLPEVPQEVLVDPIEVLVESCMMIVKVQMMINQKEMIERNDGSNDQITCNLAGRPHSPRGPREGWWPEGPWGLIGPVVLVFIDLDVVCLIILIKMVKIQRPICCTEMIEFTSHCRKYKMWKFFLDTRWGCPSLVYISSPYQ